MSAFSSDWLDLRESADQDARNPELLDALTARFALRDQLRVVDLGSGTGANLRAIAPLLPAHQTWMLIDSDFSLLEKARSRLKKWADESENDVGRLILKRQGQTIDVSFAVKDLSKDLKNCLASDPQLVTASAFFDLVSAAFIQQLARKLEAIKCAFYASITYNGIQQWHPHRPVDNRIVAAFHSHQMTDKGFGPAAGPTAPAYLADQFRLNDYSVLEGDSYWRLGQAERPLIDQLMQSTIDAVRETGDVNEDTLAQWTKTRRERVEIGHVDIFAVPA